MGTKDRLRPLLLLGLAGRFSALSLSFVNIVAVVSYWHVLGKNEAALASHYYWGLLLLVTLLHGPGKLSLDHWIRRWAEARSGRLPKRTLMSMAVRSRAVA